MVLVLSLPGSEQRSSASCFCPIALSAHVIVRLLPATVQARLPAQRQAGVHGGNQVYRTPGKPAGKGCQLALLLLLLPPSLLLPLRHRARTCMLPPPPPPLLPCCAHFPAVLCCTPSRCLFQPCFSQVVHELLPLEVLLLLLETPSDDGVEVAVDFLKEVGRSSLHAAYQHDQSKHCVWVARLAVWQCPGAWAGAAWGLFRQGVPRCASHPHVAAPRCRWGLCWRTWHLRACRQSWTASGGRRGVCGWV